VLEYVAKCVTEIQSSALTQHSSAISEKKLQPKLTVLSQNVDSDMVMFHAHVRQWRRRLLGGHADVDRVPVSGLPATTKTKETNVIFFSDHATQCLPFNNCSDG